MKRILNTVLLVGLALAVYGQKYPFDFPLDTVVTGNEFIPYQQKIGSLYTSFQVPFPFAKRYFQKHEAVTLSTSTAVPLWKKTVNINCAAGPITVGLPAASDAAGWVYQFYKIDGSENLATIQGSFLDGATQTIMYGQGVWIRLESNGTTWQLSR